MLLLLIRHGQSIADQMDVYEGRANFSLTDEGHKQAIILSKYLANNYKITKIYSSPLLRASQVAGYISKETNLEIKYEDDLMEFNNGLLAGMSRKEANEKYPEVKDLPVDKALYNQESKKEFRERADMILNKIINESSVEDIIVVITHGGLINQFYYSMLNLPIVNDIFFPTSDTGIHIWKIKNNKTYVIASNNTEHLKSL